MVVGSKVVNSPFKKIKPEDKLKLAMQKNAKAIFCRSVVLGFFYLSSSGFHSFVSTICKDNETSIYF